MKSGVFCSNDYVCESRMNTVDELKQRLADDWHSLQQNVIDAAISSDLIFSRPRSEGWPHYGRTFSIYPCLLSF